MRFAQPLTRAVEQATGGELLDDATVLVMDWYGGPDQQRGATAGATRGRASQAEPMYAEPR